ncbi:pesticin C-terminus-like muramidase [Pseudomonas sp. LS44]|uniref:pesticin C-terminus-like muramidase n=1 Tax=Pseudomonas sp. LS44 TaxID=1357074 RepID=UPI00215AAB37|nr:pesticin C-terminus-like muramidase [Pseudomonas sp. LS44]UVE17781.1 pesticin C-terminus-like muramidase [Pseudomonas sp. LS44]
MSKQPKVERWAYPFKAKSTSGPSQEVRDPLLYYAALAKAKGGFYPMGANGLWHGGVHFDEGTAGMLDQSSVRCIADGEVIAYRIDSQYPVSQYGDRAAPYSTGFVLVRHRLEMPIPQDKVCTAIPELTFYSLYMHLQNWASYEQAGAAEPAAFLSPTRYGIEPSKAIDRFLGLNVRADEPGRPQHERKIAVLPKGCKIRVGEPAASSSSWRKLLAVVEGRASPELADDCTGWVYIGELAKTSEPSVYLVGTAANDVEPGLLPGQGLNVRQAGNNKAAITGVLPLGVKVTLESGTGNYRKVKEIVDGQSLPPLTPSSADNIQGFVHFASLKAERVPPILDKVQLLAQPHPIKAGELIGHLGLYQNQDEATPSPLLHLEVFSCEDVRAFILECRGLAFKLPDSQKSLLKIHKGASQLIPHRDGIPPDICMRGETIGVDLILPLSYLESLPSTRKLQTSQPIPGSRQPQVTRWWRLDNLLVNQDGQFISGWLAEQDWITTRHSPWEWDGFEFIEESGRPIDHLVHQLGAHNQLSDEEKHNYQAQISLADQGPIQRRLYDIIDSNQDKQITTSEIRLAIEKPWHAQSISRLISCYESEWYYEAGKWDALDELMGHSDAEVNGRWLEEKKNIERSGWYNFLVGKCGITAAVKVWHIHPTALIGSFSKFCSEICRAEVYKLETTVGLYVVSKKLFEYILQIESYRQYPYALPDNNSGITIGYGYDLGQQTVDTVDKELAGLYSSAEIESLKVAIGKKGQDARDYVNKVSHISISKDNAMSLAVIMKKRYAQQVVDVYPQAIKLHPDCQGALLSLIINRGNMLNTPAGSTRRLEMRQIQDDFNSNKPELISSRFRSMKRLWAGDPRTSGLAARREKEAVFFEEALKCSCWE